MAWIYLAESEESRLHSPNTYKQSPTVRSNLIVKTSSFSEWPTDCLIEPQFGMTYEHFDQRALNTNQILSVEDFLAKIYQSYIKDKDYEEKKAVCFSKLYESANFSNHYTYSLKMYRQLPIEEGLKSLSKLPRWGIAANGVLSQLKVSGRPKLEKGFSFLPTPTARANIDSPSERKRDSLPLEPYVNIICGSVGMRIHPRFVEKMMGYPTDWTDLEPWVIL